MDREKVIHAVETAFELWIDEYTGCSWFKENEVRKAKDDAIALMKEQPQIVRCNDCKECYFASNRIESEQTFACGKHGFDVAPDWFCADGVRKDESTD